MNAPYNTGFSPREKAIARLAANLALERKHGLVQARIQARQHGMSDDNMESLAADMARLRVEADVAPTLSAMLTGARSTCCG